MMNWMDELICVCMDVKKSVIEEAVKNYSLKTVEEVGLVTEAGTSCGACRGEIEDILQSTNKS